MTVYRIGSKTFSDLVAKRVTKDSLGFVPVQNWRDSATDCKAYIKAPIPKSDVDFLAYCHELGHCKSKQPEQDHFGMFSTWCNGRLQCEYNAWVWALKYFRRLGFKITDECREAIVFALESYFNNSKDRTFAKKLAEDFERWCGVKTCVKERVVIDSSALTITFGGHSWTDWSTSPKEKPKVEKPKNWKPWHDLKNSQLKKQWKRQC